MSLQIQPNEQAVMFLRDKTAWENAIAAYNGPDPLELWYNYICWYDYNIRIDPENKFREALEKCLTLYEHTEAYKQDFRMIKLWAKYIDTQSNPLNLYQILYQRGVGTRCSAFYIGWAHYYDSANAFKQAESVYNLGFQAKAEPYDDLQEAHTKFRLSLSQRMLYNDNSSKKRTANHLIEQRQHITNLNPPKKVKSDMTEAATETPPCQNNYVEPEVQANDRTHVQAQQAPAQPNRSHSQPMQAQYIQAQVQSVPQNYVHAPQSEPTYNQIQEAPRIYHQPQQNQSANYIHSPPSQSTHQTQHHDTQQQNHLHTQHQLQQPVEQIQHTNQQFHHPQTQQSVPQIQQTSQQYQHIQSQQPAQQSQQANHQFQHPQPQQPVRQSQPTNHQFQQPQQEQTLQQASAPPQTAHAARSYTHVESDQCNLKNSAYVISSSLNYIYNDTQDDTHPQVVEYTLEGVKLPPNFTRFCKNNHESWKPLLFLEEPYEPNRKCVYRKDIVYPGGGIEFSPEEIRSRKWMKKLQDQRCVRMNQQQVAYQQQAAVATQSHDAYKTHKAPQLAYDNQQHNHQLAHQKLYKDGVEEQIEASTIRFSSDTGSGTKNKTITIKFKRDKSAPNSNSFSSSISYGEKYNASSHSQSYSVDSRQHNESSEDTNGQFYANGEGYYSGEHTKSSGSQDIPQQPSVSTPKMKKVKKVKIVSNYEVARKNSGNHLRDQYDDANLLLSIANMHSSEVVSTETTTSATNDTVTLNDDSSSNTDFNSTYSESPYPNRSNSSTPVRKLSQSYSSKTSTPLCRSLKRHTSNFSVQNDDSMCSYEQNSFFATEYSDDLKQKRLEKALATIETHLAKLAIDPFNSELCKAFLTKIDFPTRDCNEPYKLVNTTIPKLGSVKTTNLADVTYGIEKEVGRGSYGSVYKANNLSTGQTVALKYQKPPNVWEIYICTEVSKRITNYDILPGFMDLSTAIIAPNASILVTEFSPYGSLLDINNKIRQSTKKVMHESLVMHFSSQILNIVSHLHSCNIIHADIKPDNFLLMKIPNSDSHVPSLRLIDFGCAIDMKLFPKKTEFKKVIQTDGFTCIEMQEGRHWSYQTDYFCVAGTIHVMLFGEYMQVVKKFGAWDIKQKLPRYLKKHVWTDFFAKMLNIKDVDHLPDLMELKLILDDEASKMDSELQSQIRALSNLLHRR